MALRDRCSSIPDMPVASKPPQVPTFSIVWGGARIGYSFSKGKEILGIVMMEILNAEDLPKSNACTCSHILSLFL